MPSHRYEFFLRNFGGGRLTGSTPLSINGEKVHTFMGQGSVLRPMSFATTATRIAVARDGAAPSRPGPLGCGVITGAGAVVNSLKLGVGKSIAIFGTGSVGLSGIMAAKLVGAGKIIAIDLRDDRLKLAGNWAPLTIQSKQRVHSTNPRQSSLETESILRSRRWRLCQSCDSYRRLALRETCGFVGGAPEDPNSPS